MAEGRLRLQVLEEEAAAWLAAHPAPADTTALFDAFIGIPYLRDLTSRHAGYVAMSEKTLETTFCLGRDSGLPLPLPQSRAECACAELGNVAVERIYLSGSVRECSDVRLFPEEASDIDVMLQLGPVRVQEAEESQESEQETGTGSREALSFGKREDSESGLEEILTVCKEPGPDCQKAQVNDEHEVGIDSHKASLLVKLEEGTGSEEVQKLGNEGTGEITQDTLTADSLETIASEHKTLVDGKQEDSEVDQGALVYSKQEDSEVGQELLTDCKQEDCKVGQEPPTDCKQEDCEVGQEALAYFIQEDCGVGQEALAGIRLKDSEVGQEAPTDCKQEESEIGQEVPKGVYRDEFDDMFLSSENTSKFPLTTGASADLPPPDQPTGITVTMEPAGHRGFFLLRHRRLASCRHRRRLPLSARRVVALMDSVREAITAEAPIVSGPAVSTTIEGLFRDPKAIDLVACVQCPSWPSEEFATRRKPSGWPSAELVARLCRTAAFLVPVGFAGSETEALEWRLSFSRHEYIAFRSMTEAQRVCLTTLKHCKAVVGAVAKPLKSYYLKTALLWLVESRIADQWTLETMHHSLLLILRYLDACLRHDYLPCYFWPEVNLLASRSAAERAELSSAVAALRRRLLAAVLALLADWLGQPVSELAQHLLVNGCRLTREQFVNMTSAHVVRNLTGGGGRKQSLRALQDLVLNGKLAELVDTPHLPLCSALSLGVEASKVFSRKMRRDRGLSREVRNVVGQLQPILKLVQQVRRRCEPEDSWMRED